MLVAILSDIHDHSTRLLLALAQAQEQGCCHLLCLGDVATLSTFRTLCEEWPHGADVVFGNNEWNRESFLRVADEYPSITHHGEIASIVLGGRTLFLCHYPHVATRAVMSGQYDAVFFGHTHRAELHAANENRPLLLNPGDVQGRYGNPGMAIYDTESNTARLLPL